MLYFQVVSELLEKVQTAQNQKDKLEILDKGISQLRNDADFNIQTNYSNFYQGLRLIVPELDHGRKSYNMKETKIGRAIVKMLNLGDGNDKRNLLNSNKISNISCISIDFADIVHRTLRKYISERRSSVTVSELNKDLDLIANRTSDTDLDEIMLKMFRKLSSLESKWIVRIMLKKLKLGIDNNKILNIFHPDAVDYYRSNNNLEKVCQCLWNPSVKLNELNLNLFEPFQPMLSKRSDAKSFTRDFIDNKTYFVETKFDGERFQLHMRNGLFRYFSRNGFDFTDAFGENFKSGTLTLKLKNVFHDNVENIILDGEMMLWHKRKKKFGSKGMTLDVKKLRITDKCYQPCFCVYDIVYLNGKILTNKELVQRLKLLRQAVKNTIEGSFFLSEYQEARNRKDIINILNESMDTEQEGIVVKDPTSVYKYRDRKSGWFKIKMEYFEDVVTDLDLILMGGYYKASSKELKSFLVGVYSNEKDGSVLSFGKVSSGLNFEEMEIVDKRFSDSGISREKFQKESKGMLIFGKDIPDVCLEPENSLIFTVRATELTRCSDDSFRTSYTIRFPRVLKIRDDKSYEDCLSVNELLDLCQKNKAVIKLNKRHLELEEILTVKRQRKEKIINIDENALKRVDNFLRDLNFFVITGNEELSVAKIEELIESHGGTFSLHMDESIDIVLVGTITQKVEELMKEENKFDIIELKWLQRVTSARRFLKYRQHEVICIGIRYYNCLADDVDMFGDSYTDEISAEMLRTRLNFMSEREQLMNLNNSILFRADLPLFHQFTAYFDSYDVINDSCSRLIYDSFLDEIEFKYRMGKVSSTLCQTVNFIVFESRNKGRRTFLENYAKNINCKNFQVVENSQLYSEEEFEDVSDDVHKNITH